MRKLILSLGALLVCLAGLWTAVAQGHTTITSCDLNRACPALSLPYQQWVNQAKVPTPDVVLRMVEDASACPHGATACTQRASFTIWMAPVITAYRMRAVQHGVFLHELGHNYAYGNLLSPVLAALDPETFADVYSICAWPTQLKWIFHEAPPVPRERLPRLCAALTA